MFIGVIIAVAEPLKTEVFICCSSSKYCFIRLFSMVNCLL